MHVRLQRRSIPAHTAILLSGHTPRFPNPPNRCPNGTTSYLGATSCKTCGPGRFISSSSDAIGFSSFDWRYYGWQQSPADCYDCPVGTFSNSSGSLSCTPCPVGTYTESPRSTSCQPCPAGRYMKGVECLPCPVGAYCMRAVPYVSTCCTAACRMPWVPPPG